MPSATTSTGNALFQGVTRNERACLVCLSIPLPSLNCACYDPTRTTVLNSAAWVNPVPGQFGGAPFYTDYRYQRHPGENINLGRTWRIKERMSLNLRVEFSNFLNRTYYNNPSATNPTTKATFNPPGALTGGFGYISTVFSSTTQLAQPRNGTIVARFSF